jgi:hypothetical protein
MWPADSLVTYLITATSPSSLSSWYHRNISPSSTNLRGEIRGILHRNKGILHK